MMNNEERTMVGSLGEEMCVTNGIGISSLKHFLFPVTWRQLYQPELHFSDIVCHLQLLASKCPPQAWG